jgi:WD40 repeat protein
VERNDFECAAVLDGHTQDVKYICWHSDCSILYSCSYDDTIKIWCEDGGDWYCSKTLIGHRSTVWSLAVLRQGQQLLSCSDDHSLILWECESSTDFSAEWRKVCVSQEAHSLAVYSISALEDSSPILFATGSGDNRIKIFALRREDDGTSTIVEKSCIEDAHRGDVNCVRWCPLPLSCASRGDLSLSLSAAGFRQSLLSPQAAYGPLLLSAGDDGVIKLWTIDM